MSPNASLSASKQSPLPKRLQAPRTTSHLTTVSVEAHPSETSRPLLSQTIRARSSSAPLSNPVLSATNNGSSSSTNSTRGSSRDDAVHGADEISLKASTISRTSTPGLSGISSAGSRKGKEKAVEGVEEVDVVGEITAGASAATGLRRLVKKSEEEVVGGVEVPDIKVDVEDVEPPDGQSACLWYRVQLFMISLR
jgi:hypothetical protein